VRSPRTGVNIAFSITLIGGGRDSVITQIGQLRPCLVYHPEVPPPPLSVGGVGSKQQQLSRLSMTSDHRLGFVIGGALMRPRISPKSWRYVEKPWRGDFALQQEQLAQPPISAQRPALSPP